MRQLNVNETQKINGGVPFLIPVVMWAVKTTAVRVAAKGAVAGASAYLGFRAAESMSY
ncbi:hypothetical protein [Alteromonas sp. S015]|uniref:hypothetical protein n=1 Tax=Alteromonas sp. S015 TaxID=3117401 RepID=UPI002FE2B488